MIRDSGAIAVLAVPTCNRLEALRDCVATHLENAAHFGHRVEFVVADDSNDSGGQDLVISALRGLRERFSTRAWYAGPAQKRRFCELLAKLGIPATVCEFALFGKAGCGPSAGRNRNAILLHCAGEMLVSADDDTLASTAQHPDTKRDLVVGPRDNPTHFWFFADRRGALAASDCRAVDIFASHGELLGRSLRAIVKAFSTRSQVFVDNPCPHLAEDLGARVGDIAATCSGIVGDCGMYSPVSLLGHGDEGTRARLLESQAHYRTALASREVLRVAPAATISHGPPFTSAGLGLDARSLLPPFMPVAQCEEAAFCSLLARCFQHRYVAHLPWAVTHSPSMPRAYLCGAVESAECFRFCDLFEWAVSRLTLRDGMRGAGGLRDLGHELQALAGSPVRDFEAAIAGQARREFVAEESFWNNLLDKYRRAPVFWAEDVQSWLNRRRVALGDLRFPEPADVLADGTRLEKVELARELLRLFGHLLMFWPDMFRAARALRRLGIRIGLEV